MNDGDIVSIDCGAIVDGWHGDAAFSIGLGTVDPEDQKLMDVCEESMWVGIAAGKSGAKLSDIGFAIEQYVNSQGKYEFFKSTAAMASEPRCIRSLTCLTLVKLETVLR